MASTSSSLQSSSTISQLIHHIINTKQATPDFDFDPLIATIDTFLSRYTENKGESLGGEESTVDWLSSTSGAANISEAVSNIVEILAIKISEYDGNEESAAISVLRAAGNVHWAGICLFLVAAVLNRVHIINRNKMETLDLLNCMHELAKVVRKLMGIPRAKDEMLTQISQSIDLIVRGAILCCSQKTTKGVKRLRNARDDLIALRSEVKETYTSLHRHLQIHAESASNLGTNESAQPINRITSDRREIFLGKDVFLSHSGQQKSFVRQLYRELTNQSVSCFFDQDSESLPLGEDFPPRIFEAAKTCKVAVLVLSTNFLQTKWPMLELAAFVEARDITRTNPNLKILPLFFQISPDALKNIKANDKKWRKGLGISEEVGTKWYQALREVRRINGLKFSKGDDEGEFIDKIVKEIWHIITPSPRYHVRETQEQVQMCQEIAGLFNRIHSDKKRIAGLYGMPGVGKTQLGKAFCNLKLGEFEGKVCHLEFCGGDPLQRVKLALQHLCQCPFGTLQKMTNTDQAKVEFDRRVKGCRLLLVLDNITEENIDEVRYFFEADVGNDSYILLSARSLDVLVKHLNVESQTCMRVPSLEKEEALEILLERISTQDSTLGVHKQIDEVVKRLQWENDAPSRAVIVHGIGGSGKTTLGDAVYNFLRENRKGWKYSKISLPQELKEYPSIQELQSFILQDLTGKEEKVRDSERGRQRLKEVMEKESIFLYIDNALFKKPLEELLPREITNPRKLRLLLTARKTTISDVMDDCRVKCDIYSIEPLPLEAAVEVLGRKINPEKNISSLLGERPKLEVIAQKCSSCPLMLELFGGFIRRRRNADEAYENVLRWMENGDPFSGDREDRFDEERIMFAFNQLEQNAQEAFLDICSFFYGRHWEWDEVACIVGEEEMKCLEEGALIKNKFETSYWEGPPCRGRKISRISIHDLLLSVGRNKSRDNRFRTREGFMKAMQNDKLFHQIKGVWLTNHDELYESPIDVPIDVPAEVLDAMSGSLRVFAMDKWTCFKGKCTKSFDELRFVRAYQASSLPMNISKLPHLTYIKCSSKGNIKLNEPNDLSALKVVDVSNPLGSGNFNEMCEGLHPNKLWKLALEGDRGTLTTFNLVKLSYLRRLQLSRCPNLMELPESLGRLSFLEELNVNNCYKLKRLPVGFGKLQALVALNLSSCSSLEELPTDFVNLSSLQYLNLSSCESLQELPRTFEQLASLQYLNLSRCKSLEELPTDFEKLASLRYLNCSYCKSLQELPRTFEQLASLRYLNFCGCSELIRLPERLGNLPRLREIDCSICPKLSSLPQSLGGMTSLLKSGISVRGCSSLTELPEETSWLSGRTHISFRNLSRLKRLPTEFSKLTCLQELDLEECESIQELCNDFHHLEVLKNLRLRRCRGLSTLPEGFGKLTTLKTLDLSECLSLTKLPECFCQLVCLEYADLSGCSNLAHLSHDFHYLPSLIRIDLCNCKRLGAEWMDVVGATQSLCYADISGNEGMTKRWNEMQSEREQWDLLVVTESSSKDIEETLWPLILEKVMWRIFSEALQRHYSSSSLPSGYVRLILITDRKSAKAAKAEKLRMVQRNLERLQCNSKESAILYIGEEFDALPSELADRTVAHSPFHSFLYYFPDVLPKSFYQRDYFSSSFPRVFTASITLERNTVKYLSTWEDISYVSDEFEFLTRNPSGSNVELLRKLCETNETDFLLYSDEQVKVKDLEGKVVLLFRKMTEFETVVLEDVYEKLLHDNYKYPVEVVWVPKMQSYSDAEEYNKAVTKARPWPMVPKPWLVNENYWRTLLPNHRYGRRLAVVDEKGSISHRNAMPMILRWGIKAYPFSTSREAELRESEWKEFIVSCQSSLEFVFEPRVKDLEGKVVLLLFREMREFETKVLENVYEKLLHDNYKYPVEVVWVPDVKSDSDAEEYKKAVTRARPWPMVPKPWLVNENYGKTLLQDPLRGNGIVVVDEKGSISHEEAMPMILRWGIKAYPFSRDREAELRESEWKEFRNSSQSSLEFIFQNMEFFQPREIDAVIRREMVFLCVGPIDKMLEFVPQLTVALKRLQNQIQFLYIAKKNWLKHSIREEEKKEEYETKRGQMCSITSLSFYNVCQLWQRLNYLWDELPRQGVNERIVQVRRMVKALRSFGNEINIIGVDEKGEMMNGRCEEMVEVVSNVCHTDHDKLMREIESEGLSNVLRKRWTNRLEKRGVADAFNWPTDLERDDLERRKRGVADALKWADAFNWETDLERDDLERRKREMTWSGGKERFGRCHYISGF